MARASLCGKPERTDRLDVAPRTGGRGSGGADLRHTGASRRSRARDNLFRAIADWPPPFSASVRPVAGSPTPPPPNNAWGGGKGETRTVQSRSSSGAGPPTTSHPQLQPRARSPPPAHPLQPHLQLSQGRRARARLTPVDSRCFRQAYDAHAAHIGVEYFSRAVIDAALSGPDLIIGQAVSRLADIAFPHPDAAKAEPSAAARRTTHAVSVSTRIATSP